MSEYYIGTTILKCKPLSYAITNDKQKNVCSYCFKEYSKLSVCAKCNCAHYCSRQCQVEDWYAVCFLSIILRKQHKKDCSWMKKLASVIKVN